MGCKAGIGAIKNRHKEWTKEEEEFLRKWWYLVSPPNLIGPLKTHLAKIYDKARELNLGKPGYGRPQDVPTTVLMELQQEFDPFAWDKMPKRTAPWPRNMPRFEDDPRPIRNRRL